MSTITGRVHIRWMIRRDMEEVLTAERLGSDRPWTEEDFLHQLRRRDCIGMVAELNDRVIAHVIHELHRSRLHVVNLTVHPAFRRRGVARQIVEKLIGKLSSYRRCDLTVDVPDHLLGAQLFFRQLGFLWTRTIGHDDGDVYRMIYSVRKDS